MRNCQLPKQQSPMKPSGVRVGVALVSVQMDTAPAVRSQEGALGNRQDIGNGIGHGWSADKIRNRVREKKLLRNGNDGRRLRLSGHNASEDEQQGCMRTPRKG